MRGHRLALPLAPRALLAPLPYSPHLPHLPYSPSSPRRPPARSRCASSCLARIPTTATSGRRVRPPSGRRWATRCVRRRHQRRRRASREGGGHAGQAATRRSHEAGQRIGVDYVVLDNHDGELVPSLDVREQIIRQIREWKADLVLGAPAERLPPGPPLHRRAAAGRGVHGHRAQRRDRHPGAEEEPGLPVLRGRLPEAGAFRPDIAVSIDDVVDKKIDALDAHVSQVYEWLAWHAGNLDQVPKDPAARKAWLKKTRMRPPSARCARRWSSGTAPTPAARSRSPRPSRSASTARGPTRRCCGGCSRSCHRSKGVRAWGRKGVGRRLTCCAPDPYARTPPRPHAPRPYAPRPPTPPSHATRRG